MAFTKTPQIDTYKTQRFPFVGPQMQRNGLDKLKDQRWLNCFPESISDETGKMFYLKKRAGLAVQVNSGVANPSRGCIYEPNNDKVFFVVGDDVFMFAVATSTLTQIHTLSSIWSPVGFTLHEYAGNTAVVLVDDISGVVINPVTGVATVITDPDFPSAPIPAPISLDGYLFVAQFGTADIYNSDLDDPFSWTPGNFITAEMYPDNIISLAKNNNYIYAVGFSSVEYFYDAGNASGSPLSRNDSAVQQFGVEFPNSVVNTEKEVILVGNTDNGGRTVWMLEGFTASEIATETVKMSLDDVDLFTAGFTEIVAYTVRVQGHKFYVLIIPGRTWVYDFDEKMWSEWSTGTNIADNTQQGAFRCRFGCDSSRGVPFLLDGTNGKLYNMNDGNFTDVDFPIYVQATTTKLDFANMNRKDWYRYTLFGDWPTGPTFNSEVVVEWSDDDYRTWKGQRTIQLQSELPVTRRLGKSRRRAFRVTHIGNAPLRLEGFEVDVNIGGT